MHAPHGSLGHMSRTASIAAAISAITVVGVGISLSIPLLALELESRGIANKWIGINTAVAGIATIFTAPFVPLLVRKMGLRALLVGAIILAAASLVGFKAAPSFLMWFPLRFAFGAALCILFAVSEFWINALAPPNRRGLIMGIYATALSLGAALGPTILSVLGASGWAPYLAGAVVLLLGAIPILLARGITPRIHDDSHHGVLTFVRRSPSAVLAALVFGAIETAVMTFLPLYGLRLGLSETSAALLLTAAVLGNVAFQIPIGLISDKVDRRVLLFCCSLAGAAGAFTLPFVPVSSPWFLAMIFLATGVVGSLYTVGLAHLGERFHGADLAAANAAFVMLYSVGLIAGPPLAGAGMDLYNPYGFAFVISTMLAVYAAIVAGRLMTRGRRAA
ncbi:MULTISPECIES: MFS transporter [unclassified Xanthobacter]|uniref:MFS transporter n=1 Tax=Xanthobacter TaxID=279 RepID=UPI00145F45F3|nr:MULTISPECIES: MFS transporter [unclassified Xanthobacter]NMN56131.1 MFS family permease [Xanthobacter sp. SG618]UJX45561.1 MFS transporter [Xanthobacter sp. YC-JY1]